MEIHGLQKLTLLDYPGRMACTVFLAGCNLRCPFCHNSELLDRTAAAPVMNDAELLTFLQKRRGMLEGVCFTGGEPLMQPELPALLQQIKALGYPIKLDTNGFFSARLRRVVEEGLVDYVAMDVKNAPDRYAETCGLPEVELASVRESIALLLNAPIDYEFRTTVVDELHDEESFYGIRELIRGAKHYFLQPFTDRETVMFAGLHAPEAGRLRTYAEIVRPCVGSVVIRGAEE